MKYNPNLLEWRFWAKTFARKEEWAGGEAATAWFRELHDLSCSTWGLGEEWRNVFQTAQVSSQIEAQQIFFASYYRNQNMVRFRMPHVFYHSHTRNFLYICFILSSPCRCTMFEEISVSTGELLLIVFTLILLFIVVYGVISVRMSRYVRWKWVTLFFATFS